MKWADYCISKVSFIENTKTISEVCVHVDNGEVIENGEIKSRNWLVQQANNNKTFCCIVKNTDGKWNQRCSFRFESNNFHWGAILPRVLTKRKSFISYYHKDDESYRSKFEKMTDYLIINKSVQINDITGENDEYIKQLIQKEYLKDTTVLIVLIGNKTKCRKHVDWEISGSLNLKVGDTYAGLLGLILPNHPDYGKEEATYDLMPQRLADNFKTNYAIIRDWTEDPEKIQSYIELAFANRSKEASNRRNSRIQMKNDMCE